MSSEDDSTSPSLASSEFTSLPAVSVAATRIKDALDAAGSPEDGSDNAALVELLDAADSYSEASLLARAAAGAFDGEIPSLPPDLLDDVGPDAADTFVFEGWNVIHSVEVIEKLRELRASRDEWLATLSDEEFADYAAEAEAEHRTLRMALAAELGRAFDEREDAGILEAPDGSIWRRKVVDEPGADVEPSSGAAGGRSLTAGELAVAQAVDGDMGQAAPANVDRFTTKPKEPVHQLVGAGDDRDLRSAFNGFALDNGVWGPKILLAGSTRAWTRPMVPPSIWIAAGQRFRNAS